MTTQIPIEHPGVILKEEFIDIEGMRKSDFTSVDLELTLRKEKNGIEQ